MNNINLLRSTLISYLLTCNFLKFKQTMAMISMVEVVTEVMVATEVVMGMGDTEVMEEDVLVAMEVSSS